MAEYFTQPGCCFFLKIAHQQWVCFLSAGMFPPPLPVFQQHGVLSIVKSSNSLVVTGDGRGAEERWARGAERGGKDGKRRVREQI